MTKGETGGRGSEERGGYITGSNIGVENSGHGGASVPR